MACNVQRGYALISVLWLVTLLSVIAAGLAYSSRQSTKAMSGLVGGTQARYLADGGTQLVLANLLSPRASDRLLGDGETLHLELPGGSSEVTVFDENGKVDINIAKQGLIARLFYSLGVEQNRADALADAIADYRDEDGLTRLHGAEDEDYQSAGLPWEAKDGPFTSADELQRVYGMEPEIYRAVRPYITVYSRQQGVNPAVAPLQVLMAISSESVAALEGYVEQRRQHWQDDLPLPPPPVMAGDFQTKTRGVTYLLQSVARTENGQRAGTTTTVRVRRTRNRHSIDILGWHPYASTFN